MLIKNSEKTALIWKDQTISYSTVLKSISSFVSQTNIQKSSRVAIFSENRPEWVYASYAIWKKEAIAVPVDFMATANEVAYILNDCTPEIVFCSQATKATLEEALLAVECDCQLVVFEDLEPSLENCTADEFAVTDVLKTALIIYTSGTTGTPKGVMLSYDNVQVNIQSVIDCKIYDADKRVLVMLPMHHIFPLLACMIATLAVGAQMVFTPSMASQDIMDTLQKHKVTTIISVPRFYSMMRKGIKAKIDQSLIAKILFKLAEKMGSSAFSARVFNSVHQKLGGHIQNLVSGGAALDFETAKDFQTLGFEILVGFGMTEAAPMITFPRPGTQVLKSSGQPLDVNEVRIVDGEVTTKGRNVMQGYYNRPQETAEVIKDGWLYTGDLGYLDENKFLFITGRRKEIIVLSNGKNINPEEIEFKLINMSPVISEVGVFMKDDILQAVIFPDYRRAKELGIHNISDMLKWDVIDRFNKSVSPYKKLMNFTIVKEELPKTRMSKVKRFQLPALVEQKDKKREEVKEPDYQEYLILKAFLETQLSKSIYACDHFEIDLAMDSLDKVNLLAFIQSTFGILAGDDLLIECTTINELAQYIQTKKVKMDVEEMNWSEIFKDNLDLQLPASIFTQTWIKNIGKAFLRFYFKLKATGQDQLPDGPCILAPNHQSMIDGLLVSSFLNNRFSRNTYFFAKDKHVKNPLIRFIADRNNVIVLDSNLDLKVSLQKMAAVLQQGKNIMIFPEGTRTRDGQLNEFKKTFAILSRELNVPIVPVVINGAYNAFARGRKIPTLFAPVSLSYLKPIQPADLSYEQLRDKVTKEINAQLQLTSEND